MQIQGQRWEFRIGNSVVLVDNAFSWSGWGQERLLVNGETASEAGGWFGLYRSFSADWLTQVGESELRIALVSKLRGIACSAMLDGEPLEPKAHWVAKWSGPRGGWADETLWREAPAASWIAGPTRPRR